MIRRIVLIIVDALMDNRHSSTRQASKHSSVNDARHVKEARHRRADTGRLDGLGVYLEKYKVYEY